MTEQFRDYGYRAWEDVRPGDWVWLEDYHAVSSEHPGMVRVVSTVEIPPERTLTGTSDWLRVSCQHGSSVFATHRRRHHHTTVYYRGVS